MNKKQFNLDDRQNKRTGNIQTERTLTGIITTAEEIVHPKKGKPYTQWVQIGYTSVSKLTIHDGHKNRIYTRTEGLVGQALADSA